MRAQTLVAAADQLKLAQPTVTQTIRRIEDVLQVQLFDRGGGRLTPTAEARRILAEVDPAFEQLEDAIGRAARIAQSEEGLFRFGASPSVGRVLIPRVIAAMVRDRPGLLIHFDILSVSQVVEYLVSGPGEGAVTFFPITHGIVQSTVVGTGRLVGLVPRHSSLTSKERLAAQDLANETLIVFEPQSVHGQMLERFLSAGGVPPRQTHVVRFAETAIGLAEAGVGVAVVDEFSAASADLSKVSVLATTFDGTFQVFLHRNIDRVQSRFLRLLDAGLRREVKEF